jgi:hypothetical protein
MKLGAMHCRIELISRRSFGFKIKAGEGFNPQETYRILGI